jgi:hypothetical protein
MRLIPRKNKLGNLKWSNNKESKLKEESTVIQLKTSVQQVNTEVKEKNHQSKSTSQARFQKAPRARVSRVVRALWVIEGIWTNRLARPYELMSLRANL